MLVACSVFFLGCKNGLTNESDSKISIIESGVIPNDVAAWEKEVDEDFNAVLNALGTDEEIAKLSAFDKKYGTHMLEESGKVSVARSGSSGKSGSGKYPALNDLMFNVDGAIYLSGGADDLGGTIIDWVSPKTFRGGYYHGAVLDTDKYDPNNENTYCLETAIMRGAGYETADMWRRQKVNVCVLNPNFTVNKSRLDAAQKAVDKYCNMNQDNTEYGFFKNTVNIFNIVTKDDMYTWYCTKVVWHVWNNYGIDIDTNSPLIDYKSSGLYTLVSDYYGVRYFYNSSKKNAAIDEYIETAKKNIVLAEEIYLSPDFKKVYEKIRE